MDFAGGLSAEEIRRLDRIMDLEWMEFAEGWEWHALNYINPIPPIIPYPSYCVSRRCGWCRFPIQPGELITARASGGTESTAFASCDSFNDNKWYATFRRCTSHHDSCATIGYHVECSEIASIFGLEKRAFVQVAKYSYEPSVQQDERRREWILEHLHQLMSEKFTNIPPEILLMVNKYLFLHYAIASLSHVSQPDQCTIEPLNDVWAKHFNLDGIEYISSLSNSPQPGSRLLWKAPKEKEESFLYISEDHLGIRKITNDPTTGASIEKQDNPGWWRTLPITSKVLSFSDDGLKLRSFAAAPLNPTICWQHPMSPASLKNMAYHLTNDSSSSLGMTVEARMMALNFNEPEITGYSACWFKDQLVGLHVHHLGEPLDFYRELDENEDRTRLATKSGDAPQDSLPYWVYHPLNPGERVEQVWLRTRKESEDKKDASEDEKQTQTVTTIALVTNQSRTLTMGRAKTAHGEWKCISKASMGSPMQVYFNPGLDGISLFAASTVAGSDKDPLPAALSTQSGTEPETDPVEFSEASIENVKAVVICKDNTSVSGLLFQYEDGRQVCVGKFRLDHAEEPLSVAGSSSLYLGSRSSDQGKRPVQEISLSAPEYEEDWEWEEIPWKGSLAWNLNSGFTFVSGSVSGVGTGQVEMRSMKD